MALKNIDGMEKATLYVKTVFSKDLASIYSDYKDNVVRNTNGPFERFKMDVQEIAGYSFTSVTVNNLVVMEMLSRFVSVVEKESISKGFTDDMYTYQ